MLFGPSCPGLVVLGTLAFLGGGDRLLAGQPENVPAWLSAHVGEGDGRIARPVLQRARSLYLRKVREGAVRNACYFAMDATRPNGAGEGTDGDRFYVICEDDRSFRAIPAGHGSGRKLDGVADFGNGRECAKNFGNALDSELTARGSLPDRRGAVVVQGLLPRFRERGCGPGPNVHPVRWRGRDGQCQAPCNRGPCRRRPERCVPPEGPERPACRS